MKLIHKIKNRYKCFKIQLKRELSKFTEEQIPITGCWYMIALYTFMLFGILIGWLIWGS
jgi:hypothetical protein